MPPLQVRPVTLEGTHVRLEPLAEAHLDGLAQVGLDPVLWRWIPVHIGGREDMLAYIRRALDEQARGVSLPFATVERAPGRVVGSTRYMNIDAANQRLEIGHTWLARPWQRTALNTEAKLLMLRHAFESLGAVRVELKTDALNQQSRTAILRIGATFEGIFRRHMVIGDPARGGRIRDTAWYSVIAEEWPAVRAGLESRLRTG